VTLQRSEEWHEERRGCATASCFDAVLAKGKDGGESKTRTAYVVKIVCEILTGKVAEGGFRNDAMDRGTAVEPFGLMAYEAETGRLITPAGFIRHPEIANCGASPDGLIDDDGGCELKCPAATHVHLDTILRARMPPEHRPQVQGNMFVTGRAWWDFVSYDPRLPEHLQLYIERIPRDDAYITKLRDEVIRFVNEVDEMVAKLNARKAA
jgi:hypothetical protein